MASGGFLGGFELRIVRVLAVPPGQTLTDQVDIHVGVADARAAECPAVAVLALGLDLHGLSEYQPAQFLPGFVAERLAFFWGVDAFQADSTLLAVNQQRQGIAVGDANHFAINPF